MDAAKFRNIGDMTQYYADTSRLNMVPNTVAPSRLNMVQNTLQAPGGLSRLNMTPNTPAGKGFVMQGPGSFASGAPIELTDRVFHPPIPAERGFSMQGDGSFASGKPIELTDRVFNTPQVAERGFTMNGGATTPGANVPALRTPGGLPAGLNPPSSGPRIIDVTGTPVPRAPITPGPGIEGMGDFAPRAAQAAERIGPKIGGLRLAARGAARVALGPEALAIQGLGALAAAHSAATANSDGPVMGLKRAPSIFGMSGTPGAGRSFSTNAISYTSPFKANSPVAVSQAASQTVAPLSSGSAQAAPVPWEKSPEYAKMVGYTAGNDQPNADPASAPVLPAPDPHGYATVDGNKVAFGDIGDPLKDPAYINAKNFSVSTLPADQMPGAENVGLATREAQRRQAIIDGGSGGGGFKTLNDFTGGLTASTGEGAAYGLRFAATQAAQANHNLTAQTEMTQKNQELGLKQQELGLGLRKIEAEAPMYKAHASYYNGMEADRKAKADHENWLATPEGQQFALRAKGHEEAQETEKNAQKALADVVAKGGDTLAATNAYVASKGLKRGLALVPGTAATPEKGSLFWKTPAQPATAPVAAPPQAVMEYNTAMAKADTPEKKALIDARFRATYGGAV